MRETVLEPLQLVLYILAENADVTRKYQPKVKKDSSGAVRIIKDQFKELQINDVGVYVGAALRKSRKEKSQKSDSRGGSGAGVGKCPHVRRDHWHHYWYGPRNGERQLRLKWTAPTTVHPEQAAESTVIIPVKK